MLIENRVNNHCLAKKILTFDKVLYRTLIMKES